MTKKEAVLAVFAEKIGPNRKALKETLMNFSAAQLTRDVKKETGAEVSDTYISNLRGRVISGDINLPKMPVENHELGAVKPSAPVVPVEPPSIIVMDITHVRSALAL